MDAAKNFAKGTLTAGIDADDTSLTLDTGQGARFPAVSFNAVIWNSTDYPDPADDPGVEVVRVTAIATDTLTITRAQEGTSASEHSSAGKTYQLIAPFTAKTLSDILPSARTGDNYAVVTPEDLQIEAAMILTLVAGLSLHLQGGGMNLNMASGEVALGDPDGNNSGVAVRANDNTGLVSFQGLLGTNQSASASSLGTVTGKIPIHDLAGDLVGYLPLYGSIT
jgi:hypothetical protein